MVVQHNLRAMNSNRMLGITQSVQTKSAEKLASGYKINRAADDAAGLAISEKMRKQIRGLSQASLNAEDGISSVQTAEGALTEVHDMLQRMNELANKAANGTQSEDDRQYIQDEISQLTTEIDRVAETTKFNEIYLLKGKDNTTGSDLTGNLETMNVGVHDAGLAGVLEKNNDGTYKFTSKSLNDGDTVAIGGKEYTIGSTGKGSVLDPDTLNTNTDGYKVLSTTNFDTKVLSAGDSITFDGETYTAVDKIAVDDLIWAANDQFKVGNITFTVGSTAGDPAVVNEAAGTGTIGADNVKAYIEQALADGKQVTGIKYTAANAGTAGAALANKAQSGQATQIVSALEKGEVSIARTDAKQAIELVAAAKNASLNGAGAPAFKAGDSVTINGVKTIATAATPQSAKDTYDAINALVNGNTVTVGASTDAKTYTIVDDDNDVDEASYKVTKDMILSKIYDGETVAINGGGAKTVIGDIGSTNDDENIITKKMAYAKMADELKTASSIGADEEAKVENNGDGTFKITAGTVSVQKALNFSLHVGSDADMTNKISVDLNAMNSAGLGIKNINVKDATGTAATYAIDAIEDAIKKVSSQRSALGAVQNRLEHTINNLGNIVENTTSAESQIRDTDMATEMVKFSNNNILAQAGQSMLAQANQSNQGVLSILG